ncbi:MAG TPA: CBS domain-containing protein [Bryobacteraceae bacterium]
MRIGEICIRNVVTVDRNTPLYEAARLMRSRHVGDVIVIDRNGKGSIPVGIVTDRDMAVAVLAEQLDPSKLTAGDIMGSGIVTVSEDQGLFETIEQMKRKGIRRLPVVDSRGVLLGIVTVDDLLEFLGMHLTELSKVIARERVHELQVRS